MRSAHTTARATLFPLALLVAVSCDRADAAARADAASPASAVAPAGSAPGSGATAEGVAPTGAPAPASPIAAANPQAPAPLSPADSALVAAADRGRLMGRDSGTIWLVVMSDFQCPYCKTWHDSSMMQLTRDYVKTGKVRIAYLNLPLQMHPHARKEAEASMCAAAQGKFWPYSAALFRDQEKVKTLTEPSAFLDGVAREVSLNMPEFARCQRSQGVQALVESDIQQAQRMGVKSTPSFLIGEFLVEGAMPYPYFKQAVDSALVMARKKGSR